MSEALFEIANDQVADGRLTCETADRHIPGCHNPTHDLTACICGAMWWRGPVGTWHIRWGYPVKGATAGGNLIRKPTPDGAYFLHAGGCPDADPSPGFDHLCADVVPIAAAETWANGSPRDARGGTRASVGVETGPDTTASPVGAQIDARDDEWRNE